MALKKEQHFFKGMQRDLSVSKFNPEYAFDAQNIRITAREHDTLLSVSNEKGNKEIPLQSPSGDPVVIDGVLLGQNVLNNYVTLFTKGTNDNIYRLENKGTYFETLILFSGNLNFNTDYPIESISVYENNNIQKVYWVDGLNQARVINITKDDYNNADDFDFVGTIHTSSKIEVSKVNGSGTFGQGVIQYAFTYYNKYGKETNIFRTSPLLYIAYSDRGASPEETVSCSFQINFTELDSSYDFIRVYSIHRTSIDATPTVRKVADLATDTKLYVDTGTTGEIVDPTLLLYVGGEEIAPYTMTQKDNTLFLGNYTLKRSLISTELKNQIKSDSIVTTILGGLDDVIESEWNVNTQYNSNYDLNYDSRIKGFQKGEIYRLGIQFQDNKGKWSEVVFIGDYECTERFKYTQYDTYGITLIPRFKVVISNSTTIQAIKNLGYINARGVVVFPTLEDRNILCQGILCPTVANYKDRLDNSPFAQSSWFSRPKQATETWKTEYSGTNHLSEFGEVPYFQHNEPIGSASLSEITRWEIQTSLGLVPYYNPSTTNAKDFVDGSPSEFLVDENIVTMHSPDVEFDDRLQNITNGKFKLRIIGTTHLTNTLSDISITTSTPTYGNYSTGFYKGKVANKLISESLYGGRQLSTGMFWSDNVKFKDPSPQDKLERLWMVYPWHRNGSLINAGVPTEGTRPAALQRKIISNLKFSSQNNYLSNQNIWEADIEGDSNHTGITPVNSWTDSLVRIPAPANSNMGYLNYYANIDKILTFNRNTQIAEIYENGYLIYTSRDWITNGKVADLFDNASNQAISVDQVQDWLTRIDDADKYGSEPVSMKYKSTPHLVFAFNYTTTGGQVVMPTLNSTNPALSPSPNTKPFWYDGDSFSIYQDNIHMANEDRAFFWLAELYRDNVVNRFGGDTDEAILNNTWLPSGSAVPIGTTINVIYSEGDTYYQRYDCLKTYASTNEDQNSVVDLVSFMCETKINIDGRYDRNRGLVNNLSVSPTNFNLFNPVYSQKNNFFTFRTIDYERFSINYFPNSITVTKEKSLGEDIDTWTNITLATTLDLDGDKGEIVSLNTYNNEIFCFQRRGLSNILFNSRVQIPTSDGMPIEITNGLKVSGKRYISNTIGCANKWSIAESPSGLYFIDNETNSLYLFNGEIVSLSDKLGFRQWISTHNVHVNWEPVGYNNYRSFYDKNNNDVYFTYKDHCLCYSELINQFTSFMSYEGVPAMFNVSSEFYAFKDGKMWEQFAGDYNMFFGEYKPFSITFVANAEEPNDKIFNTVEFRADSWDGDNLINNKTFDTLDVWNEYQHGTTPLTNLLGHPSPLKKKFRIWRANIPRAIANNRDRIRNTWAYIKLGMNTPNTYRTEFHDAIIHYFA
ncbi:stabilization protein [Bacteroides phage PhiCrAssBcn5]|nr:stabilization protein [Bacteroides phage PhiCrAssBcn4]WCF57695.1 stabilization protein [Bacteroides phage PhiCrAssBcn5]WCF57758.1 stabilization protein [Bacteroides phage PhiCrAssBcn6]WCF57931.1 stabilization protein [Bacteroides phage PhiCrAssBcn7]WCF57997.1 stabilization protein [Bacteroides phage PhiCrAssBcn8]